MINVVEMKKELADKLIASGVPYEEAKQMASQEVDSLGAEIEDEGEIIELDEDHASLFKEGK